MPKDTMVKKIIIPYFPRGLKYVSPIFLVIGIFLMLHYPIWGAILILVFPIIVSTQYVTKIDLKEKVYSDYLSFLGLHLKKETKNFHNVDRIIITKENFAQTINTRAQSRQINWSDYTGTLIFDDNGKLDLLTRSDKKELLNGLKEFVEFLDVKIEDRTTYQCYWIDIEKI